MKVLVIGGTGHIGSYLVPRLVTAGHDVTSVSRGQRQPYFDHPSWKQVVRVAVDRTAAEAENGFGTTIAALRAEVVVDLTCFTLESARQLVEALRKDVQHFLHCGTIWIHGASAEVPTTEDRPRSPLTDYGKRKVAIETYLLELARSEGFPATLLHPGHLVGIGWVPINPAGNFNKDVYANLAEGQPVALPHLGMETLHHVHADDVAQAFERAIAHRSRAIGESFHVVSPAALTLRGYAEGFAAAFGQQPVLEFLPWEAWRETASEQDATITLNHIRHSSHCSIEKARTHLGYEPKYRSLEAVKESVMWQMEHGLITSGSPSC
jgi:nucleoside-diphosphate-sugar epimerase